MDHYKKVDVENIKTLITQDELHRGFLEIPFLEKQTNKTLCIIGRNPSVGNTKKADRTLQYLEEYVCNHNQLQQFKQILMLNLYSRIDTVNQFKENLNNKECEDYLIKAIKTHTDFLIVWGKLDNIKPYYFLRRAQEIRNILQDKNAFKLDIGSTYAPHPRNKKINTSKFDIGIVRYKFEDLD